MSYAEDKIAISFYYTADQLMLVFFLQSLNAHHEKTIQIIICPAEKREKIIYLDLTFK